MPAYKFGDDFAGALREIEIHADCLRAGHPPPGQVLIGRHEKTSVRAAADILGDEYQTLIRRIGTPGRPGASYRQFKAKGHPEADRLLVDWVLFKAPEGSNTIVVREPAPEPALAPESPPSDPIDLRRMKDRISALESSLKDAERRAADAEDIRASVLDLAKEPLRPKLRLAPHTSGSEHGSTVVLHLSDVHYGETISLEEMDGLNRYDTGVARARLGRFFSKAASLMTEHWPGKPPDEIVLCLGGDLISGNIHQELSETNDIRVPGTVREVGENIAGGIAYLKSAVKVPIRVYSVPGNHGRMSLKPQSKGRAAGSLDLLATDFAEAALRGAGITDVPFYRSTSPDAYFNVYNFAVCLTHGDTMGAKGGTGYIGPMAAIIKGHRKIVDTSWRSGRAVHYVLTAHFHTTGQTTFGYANGSVVSYGEYARDLRADPEGAKQNFLVLHPEHGEIDFRKINLGHASEGSLHAGPSVFIRPTATAHD